jgi:AcrR family transcriptional regulator
MRKNPKQSRASKSIEFISEAAIQLLNTPKSPDFTTNHIAERAGVSVGTLYRYFPDKGAILRHVVRTQARQGGDSALAVIEASQARDGESLVREVVAFSVAQFGGRGAVAFQIRTLVEKDKDLADEVHEIRLTVVRRLNEKLTELEPARFKRLSNAALDAMCVAFMAAVQTLASHKDDKIVDVAARSKLGMSLLAGFSD